MTDYIDREALLKAISKVGGSEMTLEQAREWLQHHADNTPMPGALERGRK